MVNDAYLAYYTEEPLQEDIKIYKNILNCLKSIK